MMLPQTRCSLVASAIRLTKRFAADKAWTVIKVGNNVLLNDVPHTVIKAQQGGRGRGSSFVKSTLKNRLTGKTTDKTYNSEEMVEVPELDRRSMEYSWDDADDYIFIDQNTFEEYKIPKTVMTKSKFLLPGLQLTLFLYKDQIVDIIYPHSATFTIESVDNTEKIGKLYKGVLETGAVIGVPENIQPGSKVIVNIQDETFVSRG